MRGFLRFGRMRAARIPCNHHKKVRGQTGILGLDLNDSSCSGYFSCVRFLRRRAGDSFLQLSAVVQVLKPSASLIGLSDDALREMAQVLEYRVLERMVPALCQGEDTDAMAVILSGR